MELKQLRCLVVCADVKSFSGAAQILSTTQPNVSRLIRTLEEELGFPLFLRGRKGIELTRRGRYVYNYASRALENIDRMEALKREDMEEELLISGNPTRWMAACFAGFYNRHAGEALRFQLYFGSVSEVMDRVAGYQDEIGFVYVMKHQMSAFQYGLEKKKLDFVALEQTKAILYLGKKHPDYEECDPEKVDLNQIELIQNYYEKLSEENYWRLRDFQGKDLEKLNIRVVTNSNLVIEQLLSSTALGNISSGYLTMEVEAEKSHGFPVYEKYNSVLFGYIFRKDAPLSRFAGLYVEYIRAQMQKL